MTAIEFKRFSFAYRGKGNVLQDIELTVPQGNFTVISGPCGAGKTTLCMAINGLVPHYFGGSVAGEVQVAGCNTLKRKVSDLALQVGSVMEDYESQLVAMTAADEIAFGLENRGIAKPEIKIRTEQALSLVGLSGKESSEVGSLSGGQKQRLAIAAVLATEADILVLDEPASALDPEGAEELYALLHSLNREKGLTIVVVEHDLSRVLPYIDQLVIMDGGCIVKAGGLEETLSQIYSDGKFINYVPAIYQLKFSHEKMLASRLPDWRTEREALADLSRLLVLKQLEDPKSA